MDIYTEIELCNTCANRGKVARCEKEKREEWRLAQGCYPCDCLHVIGEQRTSNDVTVRRKVGFAPGTLSSCPYASCSDYKPGLYGCPKFSKDGDVFRGEFCPYGVRTVRILQPEGEKLFGYCHNGELYEFDPSSDLHYNNHELIVQGTTLKKECAVKGIHCVRDFIQAYTPKTLDSIKGIGEKKRKGMYHFISIHGYEPRGDEWHKRSVEEQREWLARFHLEDCVRRENARVAKLEEKRQKRLQKEMVKQDNKGDK